MTEKLRKTDPVLQPILPTNPGKELAEADLDNVAAGAVDAFIWFERQRGLQLKAEGPEELKAR